MTAMMCAAFSQALRLDGRQIISATTSAAVIARAMAARNAGDWPLMTFSSRRRVEHLELCNSSGPFSKVARTILRCQPVLPCGFHLVIFPQGEGTAEEI